MSDQPKVNIGDKIRITREGVVTNVSSSGETFGYSPLNTPPRTRFFTHSMSDSSYESYEVTEKAYEVGALYLITSGSGLIKTGAVVKYYADGFGLPTRGEAFVSYSNREAAKNGNPVKLVREDA